MKNRSQRNEGVKTPAMTLFRDMKLITNRIEGMDRLEYKVIQRFQKKLLKKVLAKSPNPKISQMMGIRKGYNG